MLDVYDDSRDDNFRRLAAAIVLRAVGDYRDAWNRRRRAFAKVAHLRTLRSTKWERSITEAEHDLREAEHDLREVEDFFRSPYGEQLSGVDGEAAIETLKERLRREGTWTKKSIFDNISG